MLDRPHADGRIDNPDPPLYTNRDWILLWTGQAVSELGNRMGAIVYPLLTLAVTRSVVLAGVVSFVGMAVAAAVRLPAGVLADRWPRKPILVISDLTRAVVTATIVVGILTDTVTVFHLIAATVVAAVCAAMFDSAQTVAVRHVVPTAQLPQALAHNEARGHVAGLAGQPLGGYLFALGMSVPIIADCLSYLCSGILIKLIRRPLHDAAAARQERLPMWRDMWTGLCYVRRNEFLRVNLLCASGFGLVFGGLSLVVIASASERGTGPTQIGAAFALAGVGGILGALATKRLVAWLPPSGLVITFGCTATVAFAALGLVDNPYAIGVLLGLANLAAAPANAMLVATLISITPASMQGRVMSSVVLIAGLAAPLGPLLGGVLLAYFGQLGTFAVFAAIAAAITIRMTLSKAIRGMRRPGEP